VRGLWDRYIVSNQVWPSCEIVLTPEEIDGPRFSVREEVNKNQEWKDKELSPDSDDVQHTVRILQRLFCEAIESMSSSLAGIRHTDRFEVHMKKDRYIVKDHLRANIIFEVSRNDLFEPSTAVDLLGKARRETANDICSEEEITDQESTRSSVKICLEMLFGPEATVLAQMNPARRFTVRSYNGGYRVFDSCHPDLLLSLTAAEVKSGELDIELMYERATPTF
jgi:hypothetical protein